MESSALLQNKVCLITGAAKGIGMAIAEKFAEQGAVVYANARTENSLEEWAVETSAKYGCSVIPVYFDVTDYNRAKEVIMRIKSESGKLDVVVNNAGIVTYEMLGMIDFNRMREMFEVNVYAAINLIQLASRIMARQDSGSLINISSLVGDKGVKGQLAYSASKGALIALTRSAAKELAHQHIRVNAVAPGLIGTDRFTKIFNEKFSERINSIGMGRLGTPEEVANTCLFLASDLSTYVTGQVIGVDGSTII